MAVEVRHSGKSMEQRIADRLKPSGDPRADHHVVHGTGPTRTHTFIHHPGHVYDKSTLISGLRDELPAEAIEEWKRNYTGDWEREAAAPKPSVVWGA